MGLNSDTKISLQTRRKIKILKLVIFGYQKVKNVTNETLSAEKANLKLLTEKYKDQPQT